MWSIIFAVLSSAGSAFYVGVSNEEFENDVWNSGLVKFVWDTGKLRRQGKQLQTIWKWNGIFLNRSNWRETWAKKSLKMPIYIKKILKKELDISAEEYVSGSEYDVALFLSVLRYFA